MEVSTKFSTFADKYNVMGTKEKLVERSMVTLNN